MKILAIETSCDETAIALLEASGGLRNPKFEILENLIASQIKIHAPFGGVVPNLAKREHLKNLPILFKKILNSRFQILNSLDLICVTVGPGLEPALWTGITFAKSLINADNRGYNISVNLRKNQHKSAKSQLFGVNHLDGHLYSFLLPQKNQKLTTKNLKLKTIFPAIALIISGGHTVLLLMKNLKNYKKLGETRDDAVGESFDKVARLLGLPYPGGPEIEKLAEKGNSATIDFPRPMLNQKNYDFSFSGLKTSVLYYLRDMKNISVNQRGNQRQSAAAAAVAAAFQKAAFDVLITKTIRATKELKAKSIMVSGGVASNSSLKNYLKLKIKDEKLKINLLIAKKEFCTDNAVMIGAAGYINFLRKKNYKLDANGNLGL